MSDWKNTLYFGDNLDVLREAVPDESVDLIYLDPPFNSAADYNVLFKTPKGEQSEAQITAFEDTWRWSAQSARTLQDLYRVNGPLAEFVELMVKRLGCNDLSAYLVMMAARLVELHRVLKPTGSLYLHCDPTASHYLKIILDEIFSVRNFRNEIIWQRTNAHNTAKQYGRIHDTLLFYSKGETYCWNDIRTPYGDEQMRRYRRDADGLLYTAQDLTASRPNSDSGKFEWRGTLPPPSRGWGYTLEQLETWWAEGRILKKKDGTPRLDGLKVFLADMPGKSLQSIWNDVPRISNTSAERLGYPTQKPLALLERIVSASSNPGDVALDPFCGCGTAVHAAHKLGRRWIGIDITHLAIALVEKRLRDAFPEIDFAVEGTPKDIEGARDLAKRDKYQFQWWACSLVNAQPYQGRKKGPDGGVDGLIYFQDLNAERRPYTGKIIVSVKGGESVSLAMLKELIATVEHNDARIGLFVTLAEPTKAMLTEATKAGFHASGTGRTFPKIQILTIEGLLTGAARPEYVDYSAGGETFKKARRERTGGAQSGLF
jgi:site-specific DNA-methyltransferase (adenine-specific)